MTEQEAREFRKKIELASAWTDDADALEMVELFPAWESRIGTSVIPGERLRYNGKLYKCNEGMGHVIQADWTPDTAVSLWHEVSAEEWPEYVQPQGAADAYMTGDKVSENGEHFICNRDYTVYPPSVVPDFWDKVE